MRRRDFGGDKHVDALDAGRVQALADFALIVVHLRGVDVAITESQRRFDHAGACTPAQIPGAKPKQRNLGVTRRDAGHACIRVHSSHFSPISAPAAGGRTPSTDAAACPTSPSSPPFTTN